MQSQPITLLQIIVPASVALIVVALTHLFTSHRDRENKRREQRIDYLITVYRAFSKANHHPRLYEIKDELEQAVTDIQLFGTPKQVRLAQQFATELGTAQEADTGALLLELRDSLRAELRAAPLSNRMMWLRVGDKKEDSTEG
jgi:hypothetical protein